MEKIDRNEILGAVYSPDQKKESNESLEISTPLDSFESSDQDSKYKL